MPIVVAIMDLVNLDIIGLLQFLAITIATFWNLITLAVAVQLFILVMVVVVVRKVATVLGVLPLIASCFSKKGGWLNLPKIFFW